MQQFSFQVKEYSGKMQEFCKERILLFCKVFSVKSAPHLEAFPHSEKILIKKKIHALF